MHQRYQAAPAEPFEIPASHSGSTADPVPPLDRTERARIRAVRWSIFSLIAGIGMVVAGYPSLCSLMVGMISLIAVTNLQGWERGRKRVFACILAVTLFMFWLIFTLISLVGVAPLATKPGAQVVHGIDLSLGTTAAAMALATSARIVWRSPRPARRPRP